MARPSYVPSVRRLALYALLFAALLWVFGTQLGGLSASMQAVRSADIRWLLLALVAVVLGMPASSESYALLASPRLHFRPTLAVQVASGFVNRLLPAGLGGLSLFAAYIHKQGASITAASAIVVANNIVGIAGSLLLVTGIVLIRPDYLSHFQLASVGRIAEIAAAAIVILAVVGWALSRHSRTASAAARPAAFVQSTWRAMRSTLRPGAATAGALLCNMLLTSLNALVLCCCAWAVGAELSWPIAVLVLSAGTAIGAAVPTPGGIGGVEAGLLAGLAAFAMPTTLGLATVLLYRLLTYWLPVVPGVIAFRFISGRYV